MKKAFLLLLISSVLGFGFVQKETAANYGDVTTETLTTIKWVSQDLDLGVIPHQVPKTVEFAFTNSGKAPLIISNVQTSCGCTVAEYPKEPIMPGKKGVIKAVYSAGNIGPFHKSLTVIANIPEKQIGLNIHGEVKAADKN